MLKKYEKCINAIIKIAIAIKKVTIQIKGWLIKKKYEKRVNKIAETAMKIKETVATDYYVKRDIEELKMLEEEGWGDVDYMPTSFELAKYYGIRYEFKEIEGSEPSYLERVNMKIYISEKYREDSYAVRHLLAHEIGHFFLHKHLISEMNIFPHRTKEEYEANVFSIFLMPQIMEGEPWEELSPRELNKKIYEKVFKKDD